MAFLYSSTLCVVVEYLVLIMLCWQNLAKQVAEQAEFLRRAGEGIQLTADQSLQLEKMASLERSSREKSEKVKRSVGRVETLEQDNSALKEKASKLQERVKAATKEKKIFSSFFCLLRVVFFLFSCFPFFDRA